jgi:ribonuclease Z
VVVKKEGVDPEQYPEIFIPGVEALGESEIRLTCIGSGNPIVRRAPAATGWHCELGNSDKFVFDVDGGTVQKLWSLQICPAGFDELFLTHLHLDHVGDYHVLFDATGWARNTPLQVWGPSGCTPEMGTAAFCDDVDRAALWHIESKRGPVPAPAQRCMPAEFESLHRIRLQEMSRNACVWFTCYTLNEPLVINLSSVQEV